jgi:hypothetical protein
MTTAAGARIPGARIPSRIHHHVNPLPHLLTLRALWRARWPILRLTLALSLLAVFVRDLPASIVRHQWAMLPGYDYLGETRQLRAEGRHGEALVVADAGLAELDGPARDQLAAERNLVIEERDSYLRRATAFGKGALTGEGRGVEELAGAITADLFIVGDVRDLFIQGTHLAVDGEADDVVLALSAVGVLTTVVPEIDWAAAVLKYARKTGRMSKVLAEEVLRICRQALSSHAYGPLRELVTHSAALARKLSPAGLIRLLHHVETPEDLARLARFVEREPRGAFVLHAAGADGIRSLTRSAEPAEQILAAATKQTGEALTAAVRPTEEALVLAAKKGDGGLAWFRTGRLRLLRPHPLLGLLKSTYKGNLPRLVARLPDVLDKYTWLVIPVLAFWSLLEGGLTLRSVRRTRRSTA